MRSAQRASKWPAPLDCFARARPIARRSRHKSTRYEHSLRKSFASDNKAPRVYLVCSGGGGNGGGDFPHSRLVEPTHTQRKSTRANSIACTHALAICMLICAHTHGVSAHERASFAHLSCARARESIVGRARHRHARAGALMARANPIFFMFHSSVRALEMCFTYRTRAR